MNGGSLIYISVTIAVLWFLLDKYLYSPEAKIKRLWKEVLDITALIAENDKKFEEYLREPLNSIYKERVKKRKNLINALLEYYFDPEEDSEFIEKYKP